MRVAQIGSLSEANLYELGISIIREHARAAAVGLIYAMTPAYRAHEICESLAFFRGSGLDMVVQTFGIEIDAETFRETFYTWADHQRHHHSNGHGSTRSSATTRGTSSIAVSIPF